MEIASAFQILPSDDEERPGAYARFPYDRDLVAILDGTTAAKKSVDGSTWTAFGIAAPSGAPTVPMAWAGARRRRGTCAALG